MNVPARFFATVDDLRAWFEAHHADAPEVWIGFYKAHTGTPGVVYRQALDEALCFGWIDTTVRRIDDERYANRFTPRREGSYWSVVNQRRFEELDREGRVHVAGRRAFDRKPAVTSRRYSFERSYRFSPEFARRLSNDRAATRYFRSRPRSYRKRGTFWVMSAVRPETRERRFRTLLAASAAGTTPKPLLLPGETPPLPNPARSGGKTARTGAAVRHRQRTAGSR